MPENTPPLPGACCFAAQKNGPKEVQPVNIGGGQRVVFYAVVPVYPAEMEYKLEFGAEALERKFREMPVGQGFFMVDNDRPCAVEAEPGRRCGRRPRRKRNERFVCGAGVDWRGT